MRRYLPAFAAVAVAFVAVSALAVAPAPAAPPSTQPDLRGNAGALDDIAEARLAQGHGMRASTTSSPTVAPTPEPTVEPQPVATPRPALVLRVPVLMYHYISAVPADQATSALAVDLRVPPELFEQHLAYLRDQGYATLSAPLMWEALNGRAVLPPKPVMLTFDDGYGDAYANALPLLQKYGFKGTFFITANLIGRAGYMTWDQVKALDVAGMDIESHAMDHMPMSSLTLTGLSYQMGTSRQALAEKLGHEVRFFAYPSGDYSATSIVGAAQYGYYGAFLKSGGSLQSTDWAYMLRRSRVTGYASVDTFKTALAR